MKITVCFKVVPDYDGIAPSEWKVSLTGRPSTGMAKKILGVFDEGALETALSLADRLKEAGEETHLTALTYGRCGRVFAEAMFSAGYDEVICLKGPEASFSPDVTASALAAWIGENGSDLVVCGEMVGPGDTGSVPYRIARKLGLPVLDRVSALGYEQERGLTAERETETASESYEYLPPLLCAVSSARRPNLRMALYKDKVAAKGRKVRTERAARNGKRTPATLRKPRKASGNAVPMEGSPTEQAKRIAEIMGREAAR